MPHTLDVTKLKEVFESIFDNEEKLSSWEVSFMDNVHTLWENGVELSDARLETLEKIYMRMP